MTDANDIADAFSDDLTDAIDKEIDDYLDSPLGGAHLESHLVVFGRFGVTWRALEDLDLTAQIDAHSSPYGASSLSPLSDAAVMPGLGGTLRITEHMALEVAVTEDDGTRHAAPDIGLHVAMRWQLWE